jgi:hypothetical protein
MQQTRFAELANRVTRAAMTLMVCLVAFGPMGCEKHGPDKVAIRDVWQRIELYFDQRDGASYAASLTGESLAVYDYLMKVALNGKKEDVLALSHSHQAEVLRMRNRVPTNQLSRMRAADYLRHTVEQGWYDAMGQGPDWWIMGITVKDDGTALGAVHDASGWLGISLKFVKENDQWKLDERSFEPLFERWFKEYMNESGAGAQETLLMMEEVDCECSVPPHIWDRMLR